MCWGGSLFPDTESGAAVRRLKGVSQVEDFVDRYPKMCARTGKEWRCAGATERRVMKCDGDSPPHGLTFVRDLQDGGGVGSSP